MADPLDFVYLRRMIDAGVVRGEVLEIGSLNHQGHDEGNAKVTCERAGLRWEGADFAEGPGVDMTFDVLDGAAVRAIGRTWQTVLLFNLLEHVYAPIEALDNARRLLAPGGTIVISSPVVWELHDYPADYWRPLPGFYFEYARRNGLEVVDGSAQWLTHGQLIAVDEIREGDQLLAPSQRFVRTLSRGRRNPLQRALAVGGKRLGATVGEFPFTAFAVALAQGVPAADASAT